MSGLFGSTTIKGTRITDFSGTSAEVGKAIPFGYGAFPVDGFIGWAPLPPVEHRQVKRQGKGGVKQETFTYTLSYMIAFARGPIYGFKWIKRQGKVVYTTDPNAPIEDQAYAAKWAQRVNFHYGTPDQLPDSLIESYEGAGNVSSFPNLCYLTIEDEDTTDNGGAPGNYEACVIASPPNVYLTSQIYPLEDIETLSPSPQFGRVKYEPDMIVDEAQASASFISATLVPTVIYSTYNMPQEDNISMQQSFVSADLVLVAAYTTYNHPPEDFVAAGQQFVSAGMEVVAGYQTYNMPQEDNVACGQSFIGATLS